jgi:hypothetical protein
MTATPSVLKPDDRSHFLLGGTLGLNTELTFEIRSAHIYKDIQLLQETKFS